MSPWRFSVHHPILTVMVMLIAILLGGISLMRLPIDLMPEVTYPRLSVSTYYEGASPEEIEELVTRPIEQALSSVQGVEELSSVSVEGQSSVRVMFSWGTELDGAANDMRDRLDRIAGRLPEEADRPSLHKFDLASFPILILGASSNLDPVEMRRILDEEVRYRVERVPGVASLSIYGGHERQVHVRLFPDKVKALGIPLDLIVSRLRSENVDVPAGGVYRGRFDVTVRTLGTFKSLDDIRGTVIAVREGAPVRLSEIAEVDDSWKKMIRTVRVDGRPGVRLGINKQSGTNTAAVARGVLREVERVNRDIPQISLIPILNSGEYIERSITNVSRSALLGGALAVIVLLFFLRDLGSTAIIAVAIPVSVVTTFALMYFAGFTLNIMTLGGLALGVGMLVDNAIVVLENVHRLRETGATPFDAAKDGSGEVAAAIVASTLTTLAVFLPLIFMRGMAGIMFTQFSYVVAFSLLCSLAVALTVVPMLAARARHAGPKDAGGRGLGGVFSAMEDAYVGLLSFALRNRAVTILIVVGVFAGSIALVPSVGAELMPTTDEGSVRIDAELSVGTRLEVTDKVTRDIEDIIGKTIPEARSVVSSVGGPHWRAAGANTADIRISLVPLEERTRSSEEVANDLRRKLSRVPGAEIRTRASGFFLMRMMARSMGSDRIEIEIRGYDLETASALAERVKAAVKSVEGVTDARISRKTGAPEQLVRVNRRRAADMGLSVSQIANALQTALAGTTAGYYRAGGSEYGILVKMKDAELLDLRDVLDLTVTNSRGEPVVLRNVVDLDPREGPVQIERKDQERIVTVNADYADRDMGSIVADIREELRKIPVPRDFQILFGGDYEEQQESLSEMGTSLILALLLVYMVMAALYESLRDPFIVMFSVPLAVIGVILMLRVTGTTINIQSGIGCIMLGGIVVNNAILLVDHTNLLRRRDGMRVADAVREAGRRRLRPILMTALTTILGLTPLALGLGEGGEAQAPMARAVIGGLLSSTLITLVIVPVVYSLFEGLRERGRREGGPEGPPAEVDGYTR
ncbi:MAG: efflux RND transporter permease subunit [Planctomycetota bacterium]